MKFKKLQYVFLLMLITCIAKSQSSTPQLKAGDQAPMIKALEWIKEEPVTDLKKGRIYLIEFGATWCAPCRQAIPKLSEISKKYAGDVSVISFFVMEHSSGAQNPPAYVGRVKDFVNKQGNKIEYSVAVDGIDKFMERSWLQSAGLNGIPHSFLIDKNQRIAWIGSHIDSLDQKIQTLIASGELNPSTSIKASESVTLFTDAIYASSLSTYSPGQFVAENSPYINSYQWSKSGGTFDGTTKVYGESLRRLYYMAFADTLYNFPPFANDVTQAYPDTVKHPYHRRSYGKFWYKPIFELSDSSAFQIDFKLPQNRFNYFQKIPGPLASARRVQYAMQRDLQTYFGYDVSVEERLMPCWKLVIKDGFDKAKLISKEANYRYEVDTKGNHRYTRADIRDIIFQLEIRYGYGQNTSLNYNAAMQPPFVDATGISSKINYVVNAADANEIIAAYNEGRDYPFTEYRKMLNSIGLDLAKSTRKMKVVVIRAPKR